jgi:NADH-quinone oxidoreductase subunit J
MGDIALIFHHALSSWVFYLFAVLAVGWSLVVVTSRNVFHSALALTGVLCVVGGLYALLGADFLAASQILIYVGGIMVIMLFVVMWSQRPANLLERQTNEQRLVGVLLALIVGAGLVLTVKGFSASAPSTTLVPTSAPLGRLLMGDMVLPFEVVSLVLLAALVGAVLFSQDYKK